VALRQRIIALEIGLTKAEERRTFDLGTSKRANDRVINDDEGEEGEEEVQNDETSNNSSIYDADDEEYDGKRKEREVSVPDDTQIVATQLVEESNVMNAGEFFDRGDKVKAKDREGKRESSDIECTSTSMPRKKANRIHYSVIYMCSYFSFPSIFYLLYIFILCFIRSHLIRSQRWKLKILLCMMQMWLMPMLKLSKNKNLLKKERLNRLGELLYDGRYNSNLYSSIL